MKKTIILTTVGVVVLIVVSAVILFWGWQRFKPVLTAGQFCGGVAGIPCFKGYTCSYDDDNGQISDAVGHCVPEQPATNTSNNAEPIEYNTRPAD